jgi:hypothetical protein
MFLLLLLNGQRAHGSLHVNVYRGVVLVTDVSEEYVATISELPTGLLDVTVQKTTVPPSSRPQTLFGSNVRV